MRGTTAIQVIHLLRKHKGVSRADLAQAMELDRGVVTRAIAPMVEKGWIVETKQPARERGKPPIHLTIHPQAFFSIGVSIVGRIIIAVIDADGKEVKKKRISNVFDHNPKRCIKSILLEIRTFVERGQGVFLGVGVASPGYFDETEGQFVGSPYISKESSRMLYDVLADASDMNSVHFEGAPSAVSVAEWKRDIIPEHSAVLSITDRLELGVVINNQLYRGADGVDASIACMQVGGEQVCGRCHQKGCLGAYADLSLIADKMEGIRPGKRQPQSYEEIDNGIIRFLKLLGNATASDKKLIGLVRKASKALAVAADHLVIAYQPQVLVFDAWLAILPEHGIELIRKTLDSSLKAKGRTAPKIYTSLHSPMLAAIGVGILVQENYFGKEAPRHIRISNVLKLDK